MTSKPVPWTKKTGICTVEGTALSVNSIPNTGFLSYPRRTGYETVIHTFPVTMKTSLLSVQKKNSSDWIPPASLNVHSHNENSSHTIITPLQQLTIPKTLFITLSFQIQKKDLGSDMVRECNRAVYEGQLHFFPFFNK